MARLWALLLVAALVGYGASAPFAHAHAHGRTPDGRSTWGPDPHCDRHHEQGAHWHHAAAATNGAPDGPAMADTHRHAAVGLATGAIETGPPHVAPADAVTEAGAAVAGPGSGGAPPPATFADGPDPPPCAAAPARAPPPAS